MLKSLDCSSPPLHGASSLIALLENRSRNQPVETAYIFLKNGEVESGRLTYADLARRAKATATYLQKANLARERALILCPSGLEFIIAFFGCLYAGAIAVPAYPPRRNRNLSRLQAISADAQPAIILTTEALMGDLETKVALDPYLRDLPHLAVDQIEETAAQEWEEIEILGDRVAFLQYTSGSTGKPKGVAVSHQNLISNQESVAVAFGHSSETIFVGWLPLFHDMGLVGNVMQPLYLGIPCILMSPVEFLQRPKRWLQAISNYRATTSGGPNFAYDLCVRKVALEDLDNVDLSSWTVAFNGAEPIRADTIEQFSEKFAPLGFRKEAFYPCYGMAETSLFVTGGKQEELPCIRSFDRTALEKNRAIAAPDGQKLVGCGHTWLNDQVVIADPQTLTALAPGNVGEIWVSSPSVALGYWQRETETQETFEAYLTDTGEGPYLRTGDLGFCHEGELFVSGRIKDLIIIRGQNYYPQDIELTVERSDPALRPGGGAAFSVTGESEEQLIVVQEVERTALHKIDCKEVLAKIREAIATEYALQAQDIVLVKPGTVPKTSSGKIQRRACRTLFLEKALNVIKN
jgi:acyl-CoA synthetase (AMP-forming)/AMP-acid ligase II